MPKLSIITINLNNSSGLKKTLESVLNQTYRDYEYILIDGDSVDGSKQLIENHKDKFAYWISESDKGIFNAMNKGVKQASGEYLLFLNSGDCFYNYMILNEIFKTNLSEDIVYGNVIWEPALVHHQGIFPDTFTFEYFKKYSLPHQATLIKKEMFETVGLYDESYKVISDWLFFVLALYKYNCSYRHLNQIISICDSKGMSFEPANWPVIVTEKEHAMHRYFSAFLQDLEYFYALRNELDLVKRTRGYKIQMSTMRIIKKLFQISSILLLIVILI